MITVALLWLLSPQAMAGLTLLTSRSELPANDAIGWETAGPAGSHPTSPFSIRSQGGVGVTVSQDSLTNFGIFVQTPVGSPEFDTGWGGNFNTGDYVLGSTSGYGTGPITLTFDAPISAAGAQIESSALGAFIAKIEAFDSLGNSLGSFTESGTSTYTADGSAIFLGIASTTEDIASVQFILTSAVSDTTTSLGLNLVSFASTSSVGGSSVVPEPSSAVMGFIAISACLAAARLRTGVPRR